MSDISDKAVQDALRAAEGGLLLTKGQVATLRARFEADARAIRAASVMRTSAARTGRIGTTSTQPSQPESR